MERLTSVRKALVERPGLELEIPTAYSRELDAPALLDTRWEVRLRDFAKGPVDTAERKDYLELLEGFYRAQTGRAADALLVWVLPPDAERGPFDRLLVFSEGRLARDDSAASPAQIAEAQRLASAW